MVEAEPAGLITDGQKIEIYTLTAASGLTLRVTNLGAAAIAILLPDSREKTDVLLGFRTLDAQLEKGPMFGVTLGRCAGKILNSAYVYNGRTVELSRSHGIHHAHGGVRGFDKHAFTTVRAEEDTVTFRYCSPDGEEGYPGNLTLDVTYRVCGHEVELTYEALADADTPVSISNHMYLNLYGNGAGRGGEHIVAIRASETAGLDKRGLPDGRTLPVAGTPMDLRRPVKIKDSLEVPCEQMRLAGGGFDHDYLLDTPAVRGAVRLEAPGTGRAMELDTDLPCIHFYLCDLGEMQYPGKAGAEYTGQCGMCFQPMYAGDRLHHQIGPSPILRAGELWKHETVLRFQWKEGEEA